MVRFLLLLPCFIFSFFLSFAQDAHYWSSNYGPGVMLTPGSVIASNGDSGVLFYNPALLSHSNKGRIAISSITANIYQLESIKVKDGTGTGMDLKSRSIRIVPQMLSGSVSLGKKAPVVVAYALINAPGMRMQASQRRDDRFNVLDDDYSPGPEFYTGDYVTENRVSNITALLSTGFRLSPQLSAGFSMEAQLHEQRYSVNYHSRALANADVDSSTLPIVSSDGYYLATYSHLGLQFKAGLAYDAGRHHLGLMVSSPLVHLWGSGTIVNDLMLSNIRITDGIFLDQLANARQDKLPAKWKVPLSIGAGYAYDYGRGQLYLAAEYFLRVKAYNVLTPRNEAFIRPDTGNNRESTINLLRLIDQRKAVVNFALGASYRLRPSVTAYCAFRTDMSYAERDVPEDTYSNEAYTAYWNNLHCALGANFRQKKFNFRTGLLLAYGLTSNYPQDINFDHPNEGNLLLGDTRNVKARRFSLGFMLSYIHNL
ncbi:hypothetical protein [Chitinophaga japonensis]|uniref:Long-subunit fatty acid transport protein n=1 Tax=Chitinophaga japonensis TaxID=104662 RepID=A0A562ST73_CHIJA|nr:hypothetical protein [Chitinophaga japonensis]TWI83996.1 hypothetical protein LX66_4357 [Chitinophaga japonensis]